MANPPPPEPSKLESMKKWFQELKKDKKRMIIYGCVLGAVIIIIVVLIIIFASGAISGAGGNGDDDGSLSEVERIGLEEHNKYRAMHGCPPLVINHEISKYAQEWAQENADNKRMKHREHPTPYGENIAFGGGHYAGVKSSVERWYNEIKLYDFDNPGFGMKTGHFTQVIWKSTKELGCGEVVASDGNTYTVCNYKPGGNSGGYSENVPKAIG